MLSPIPIREKSCNGANCNCRKAVDAKTGFEVTAEFERFNQKYDMFKPRRLGRGCAL